jgi:hypothetical protein
MALKEGLELMKMRRKSIDMALLALLAGGGAVADGL